MLSVHVRHCDELPLLNLFSKRTQKRSKLCEISSSKQSVITRIDMRVNNTCFTFFRRAILLGEIKCFLMRLMFFNLLQFFLLAWREINLFDEKIKNKMSTAFLLSQRLFLSIEHLNHKTMHLIQTKDAQITALPFITYVLRLKNGKK